MSIDLSQDWQLVEGPQTVEVHPRTSETTYGPAVVVEGSNRQMAQAASTAPQMGEPACSVISACA